MSHSSLPPHAPRLIFLLLRSLCCTGGHRGEPQDAHGLRATAGGVEQATRPSVLHAHAAQGQRGAGAGGGCERHHRRLRHQVCMNSSEYLFVVSFFLCFGPLFEVFSRGMGCTSCARYDKLLRCLQSCPRLGGCTTLSFTQLATDDHKQRRPIPLL